MNIKKLWMPVFALLLSSTVTSVPLKRDDLNISY